MSLEACSEGSLSLSFFTSGDSLNINAGRGDIQKININTIRKASRSVDLISLNAEKTKGRRTDNAREGLDAPGDARCNRRTTVWGNPHRMKGD